MAELDRRLQAMIAFIDDHREVHGTNDHERLTIAPLAPSATILRGNRLNNEELPFDVDVEQAVPLS